MVKLRTLGECVIEVGDARIAPDSKVVFALLLYLGLERGKRMTRTALMEMFWPDSPPAKAAHSLRQTIYQCRKLGAEIEATKTDILLRSDRVDSDLTTIEPDRQFEARIEPREFLPSYEPLISHTFTDWMDRQRSLVNAKLRRRMLVAIGQLRARGEWQDIEFVARDLLRLDPLNEEGTLVLAEATAMRGNKAGAIGILERFAKDVGGEHHLNLPATVLRRRIAEQFQEGDAQVNPFVGRSDALELLNRHLRRAKQGEGSGVLVWGEPGIGKSRLVTEFQRTAKLQGFQTIKVECQPPDAIRPLSVFIEAVPSMLQLRGSLGCSPTTLELLQTLTKHSVDDSDSTSQHVLEDDGATKLHRAIIDLVDAIVAETPLAMILEDVHWLDAVSWNILSRLVKACGARRLLVILTSREQFPSNAPQQGCDRITKFSLKPLADSDAQILFQKAASLTGIDLAECEEQWFISVAEGNPYFVRELARHYADTRQTYAIPASLETLLSERLRRISSNALRLLQVCALLGRHSTFDRVEKVLQTESLKLFEALEELELRELVVTEGTRLNTKHALLSDQAVHLCAPSTRRLLHRKIANVLELEVLETNAATLLWTCADHLRLAGESSRATKLAQSCAGHLIRLGLLQDAVLILEQAQALATDQVDRLEVLRTLSVAYRASKNWPETAKTLKEVRTLRTVLSTGLVIHDEDELRLIEACWFAESCEYGGYNWPQYVSQLLSCTRSLESSKTHRLEAARAGLVIADNASAPNVMDEFYASVKPLLDDDSVPHHQLLWIRAIYGTARGDLDDALKASRDLISHYRSTDNVWELIKMLHNSSLPLRYAGAFEEAEQNVREAIALAQQRGLWRIYIDALDTLGTLQLFQDRYEEARESQRVAMDNLPDAPASSTVGSLARLGAQIAIAEGDISLASRLNCSTPQQLADPTSRYRDDAIATDLIIAAESGHDVNPELVEALGATHLLMREAGRCDFTTAGLLVGLRAIGRHDEARSVCDAYVNKFRRERYPIPCFLRRLMRIELSHQTNDDPSGTKV